MFIRAGEARDFAAIAQIYSQAIATGGLTLDTGPFEAEQVRAWVDGFHDREILLVLERSRQVIGWGIVRRYSDRHGYRYTCETSTYLDPTEQGKGYGRRLQQSLLQRVKQFGYRHVVAKVLVGNPSSLEFHKRFGFRVVGIQKEVGYSQGQWRDVVILQLLLPQQTHRQSHQQG